MLNVRSLSLFCWFVFFACGLAGASYAAEVQPRIIGGSEAKAGDHEYFVALVGRSYWPSAKNDEQYTLTTYCGASLIKNNLIITAAHCVDGLSSHASIEVLIGNNSGLMSYEACTSTCFPTDDEQASGVTGNVWIDKSLEDKVIVISASDIFIHPLYNPETLGNDIALLRLPSPVNNATLKLPDQDYFASHVLSKTKVTAIGHGDTIGDYEDTLASPKLLQVALTPRSDAECSSKYRAGFESSNMICAGDPGFDSCQGDSGGPLFDANGYLLGIVSWGPEDCGTQAYGVYADVFAFKSWIESDSWSNSPAHEELRFHTYTSADGEVVRMGAGSSGRELWLLTGILLSLTAWRRRHK